MGDPAVQPVLQPLVRNHLPAIYGKYKNIYMTVMIIVIIVTNIKVI